MEGRKHYVVIAGLYPTASTIIVKIGGRDHTDATILVKILEYGKNYVI